MTAPETATGNEPLLVIQEVSKSYGSRPALKGVSFDIEPGQYVSLLGPNGAGKTTLFQLLAGLFVPDSGSVHVRGFDMRREAVKALSSIGFVFQQATLDLDLSVRENLAFHGRLHGLSRTEIRQRTEQELRQVDLEDRIDDRARSLSGGQRRRVELARSLLHEPSILLMDEPTVGLDPPSRSDLLEYVLQLKRERSMAVLWATHLVDEAEVADHVIMLHQGTIRQAGEPAELVSRAGLSNLHDTLVHFTTNSQTKETP